MRQFEIDGRQEFNLKNTWEDLLFNDYIEFQKLEREKDLLGIDENYVIKVLLILTDCTENDILNIQLDLLNEIMIDVKFINLPIPKVDAKFIEIDGEKWSFKKDLNKLTMGEYISIKTFQENAKDDLEATSLVLSCLFRKVKEEKEDGELVLDSFKPDDCKKISDLLKTKVKLVELYHYLTFFFDGTSQSTLKDTEAYSAVEGLKQQTSETTK